MYILVQKLDSNRRIQATTPRKPTCIRTAPPSSTRLQRSRTTASERRSRKSLTYKIIKVAAKQFQAKMN
ncbi:unnamed protein product [Adineta ricciae]|uniref:Uncharacterized protein n=1 Tax=Adineta ricciae TaxID=249248 RepID=A0A813NB77_ADIRI|nr:unnamed protein product [Adineta ricciae]